MDPKVKTALKFATLAHEGQKRKNSGIPYISHPIDVLNLFDELVVPYLEEEGYDSHLINNLRSACLCHDVIEDTSYRTIEHFAENGVDEVVFEYSTGLTDTAKEKYSFANRKERKAIDAARMAEQPMLIQLIKICDIAANVRDYVNENPSYAIDVFIPEKIAYIRFLVNLPPKFKKWIEDYLKQKTKEATQKMKTLT